MITMDVSLLHVMCNFFSTEVPFMESMFTNLWSLSLVDISAMTIIEVDVLLDMHRSIT